MSGLPGRTLLAPAGPGIRWNLDKVVDLVLHPERFFAALLRDRNNQLPLLAIWLRGMAGAIDSLDMRISTGRLAADSPILSSWVTLWLTVIAAGVIGGALVWLLGGWWYRVRLRFSGARDVDERAARLVFIHAELVWAVPMLVWTILVTPIYPTYHAAHMDAPLTLSVIATLPWSIWVSYRGVRQCFDVTPVKARIWFLILPLTVLAVVIGGVWVLALFWPF